MFMENEQPIKKDKRPFLKARVTAEQKRAAKAKAAADGVFLEEILGKLVVKWLSPEAPALEIRVSDDMLKALVKAALVELREDLHDATEVMNELEHRLSSEEGRTPNSSPQAHPVTDRRSRRRSNAV